MVDFILLMPVNHCNFPSLCYSTLLITFSLIALMHINAISLIFVEKGQLGLFLCVLHESSFGVS